MAVALRRADPLWRIDVDGSLVFVPNAGQREYIESPAEELLFSGPWGNGKTIALIGKLWAFADRYPGAQMALIRKIYADLRISTLRHFRRVLGDLFYYSGLFGGERPERFDFPNGSSVDFIGVAGEHSRTDRLLGTEYSFIGADECTELSEGEWEMARGRLRQPGIPIHQIVGACNPSNPQHFLYHRFLPDLGTNSKYRDDECRSCKGAGTVHMLLIDDETGEVSVGPEPWPCLECAGNGTTRVLERQCIVAGVTDNEENHPPSYNAMKRNLRGTRRKRFFEGKWVAFEGQVYENFDPAVHAVDRPKEWPAAQPPVEWPRYLAIDFGYTAPFVCQWWAQDPERSLWLYREIYHTKIMVTDHATEIHRLNKHETEVIEAWWLEQEREKYDEWEWRKAEEEVLAKLPHPVFHGRFADHDAEGRATLTSRDIITTAARKEKKRGIESVMEALDIVEVDGRKRTGIYILKDALVTPDEMLQGPPRRPQSTLEEFGGYRWLPQIEGRAAKEDTMPDNDHGMDALRYLVHTLRVKGEGRIFGLRG
jgi:phage terminase large subunit